MNPKCEIHDDIRTISNSSGLWGANYTGVIKGYSGSTAEEYAKKYDRTFEPIDDMIITTAITTTTATNITTTTSVKSNNYNLGDVNNDGHTNAVDASIVLSYYAMISTNKNGEFDDNQKAAADVNHDGLINAVDASCILSYYAYISTTKEEILSLEAFLKK